MSWNYRVLRFEESDGVYWYAVHEVHYLKGGEVSGWTEQPADVGSETRDGLLRVFAMMTEALGQPVLDGKTGMQVEDRRVLTDHLVALLQRAKELGDLDAELSTEMQP